MHCGVLSVGVSKKLGLPSPFDIRFGNPLDLHAIWLTLPDVPIIVPHFGAGFFREALMLADLCPNVHLDTSSSNGWMRYTPGLTLSQVFRTALAVVGPDPPALRHRFLVLPARLEQGRLRSPAAGARRGRDRRRPRAPRSWAGTSTGSFRSKASHEGAKAQRYSRGPCGDHGQVHFSLVNPCVLRGRGFLFRSQRGDRDRLSSPGAPAANSQRAPTTRESVGRRGRQSDRAG